MSSAADHALSLPVFPRLSSTFAAEERPVERQSESVSESALWKHFLGFANVNAKVMSTASTTLSTDEYTGILESYGRQKDALKKKLVKLLCDAREEAAESHSDLVPLTPEAENACRQFGDWVADRFFLKGGLNLVATASLCGGAIFVAIYSPTGRRIDIEFSPEGDAAEIFLTDKHHRVISEPFSWKRTDWYRYTTWLFQPEVPAKE